MKTAALVIALMLSLLASGCATRHAGPPGWISGEDAEYTSARYLIGRGQAAAEEEAKDRARADLSKVFQVAVAADSEDVQKFKSAMNGPGQYEGETSRRITTHTRQVISGIRIAELWQDPATKTYHALAVLPRLQAAASMRQQIGQLDESTGAYIEQSRKDTDLFLKIAAANLAVESRLERESVQKLLQVVDPTGRGIEPQWSLAKLNNDLGELLKRVRIASDVAPESSIGFTEVVAGALAKAGFMIETSQRPDFVLRARMDMTDLGFQEGWYWQRGVLEIVLSEAATGRVRGTKRWNIKSSGSSRESAASRALSQADAVLRLELKGAIIDMAISR